MQRYRELTEAVKARPTREKFTTLLDVYPLLHGYWIAYANHEFVTGDADAARSVYLQGLEWCQNSCDLWCAYIRFLIETHTPSEKVTSTFLRAEPLVGTQFLSHNFWDLWLEYIQTYKAESKLELPIELGATEGVLYHILKNRTLHQFSRYFKALKLVTKLEETHLIDLYTKQQSRVSKVWRYERNIKRLFFHPSELSDQERKTWVSYIDFIAPGEKINLYARATQLDAYNEQLWMRYVRWLIASKKDPVPVFELASKVLPTEYSELRLYYLLWLEHTDPERLEQTYWTMPRTGAVCAEHAKLLEALGKDPVAMLRKSFEQAVDDDFAAKVLAVWAKYEPGAFDTHKRSSVEFYRSWLQAIPQDAEQVLALAPASSVDAEYLRALRRTDLKRYLQMEKLMTS